MSAFLYRNVSSFQNYSFYSIGIWYNGNNERVKGCFIVKLFNSKQFGKSSYIAIGAIIGILVGTTVSLFRLFLGKTLEGVVTVYSYLQESPQWIPVWFLFSMVMAVILVKIVKIDPDIK